MIQVSGWATSYFNKPVNNSFITLVWYIWKRKFQYINIWRKTSNFSLFHISIIKNKTFYQGLDWQWWSSNGLQI